MDWENFDPTKDYANLARIKRLEYKTSRLESARKKFAYASSEERLAKLDKTEKQARYIAMCEPFMELLWDFTHLHKVLAGCPFPVLREAGEQLRLDRHELQQDLRAILACFNMNRYTTSSKSDFTRAYENEKIESWHLFRIAVSSSSDTEVAVRDLLTQLPDGLALAKVLSSHLSFGEREAGIEFELKGLHMWYRNALAKSFKRTRPVDSTGGAKSSPNPPRPSKIATWLQELQGLKSKSLRTSSTPSALDSASMTTTNDDQQSLRSEIASLEQQLRDARARLNRSTRLNNDPLSRHSTPANDVGEVSLIRKLKSKKEQKGVPKIRFR